MNEGCSVMLDNDRLFVIGGIEKHYGFSDKIYCLSLGPFGGAQSEWEWQSVSRMQTKRCWSSSIAVKDSLVVIGGRNHWRSQSVVERYDYAQDQWQYLKQCHFPRFKAGICFDGQSESIFIGGGYGAEKKVEQFDVTKNEWLQLADTRRAHADHPVLWKDGSNLFIASVESDTVEALDLRMKGQRQLLQCRWSSALIPIGRHSSSSSSAHSAAAAADADADALRLSDIFGISLQNDGRHHHRRLI